MKHTRVINLYGGSGIGKSTTAAKLFAWMKDHNINVELVREYIKGWAWDGRKAGIYDQLYILGQQSHAEARLYGKVDFVVTDSPYFLGPFYEMINAGLTVCLPSAIAFKNLAEANGVTYHHFFLTRTKPFDPRGRYETEEQAKKLDGELATFLEKKCGVWATQVSTMEEIIQCLVLEGERCSQD